LLLKFSSGAALATPILAFKATGIAQCLTVTVVTPPS
jgi:hypothetical protein